MSGKAGQEYLPFSNSIQENIFDQCTRNMYSSPSPRLFYREILPGRQSDKTCKKLVKRKFP